MSKFSWNTDGSFPLLSGGFITLSVCSTIAIVGVGKMSMFLSYLRDMNNLDWTTLTMYIYATANPLPPVALSLLSLLPTFLYTHIFSTGHRTVAKPPATRRWRRQRARWSRSAASRCGREGRYGDISPKYMPCTGDLSQGQYGGCCTLSALDLSLFNKCL